MHDPVYTEETATDAEGAHALLAAAYGAGSVRFEPSGDLIFGRRRQDLGEVRVDEVQYSFLSEYDMDPLGYVLILRMRDGEMEFTGERGPSRRYGAGDVFLCAQPDEGYHAITRTRSAQAVGLDLSLIEQACEGAVPEVLRRLERGALRPEQARLWRRTVDYVTDLVADADAAASPLVLGAAGRMLAASTIAAFTAEAAPSGIDEPIGSTQATVRRAAAFLEANPDLDLGVVEIARAAHVSVRTLQAAFRRHLDTTPMTYLRRVRLDRVRAELSAADPAGGLTVTQIAARWGFADLSRFGAHYRRMYGESPSETLRR
ncbi:AraC family transcriptional regulator [Nocardioides nematodiphilus]|uniref:AraC family transcriptional regulator n=1 Tax=Nocardioides nematodiphilus TaxID=2849669 RepID=UPI001CD9EF6F|nr:helix-turn-helix domain-containing protein [Nocardioides nematodiphilus]MCA1983094.1 helix-turn-helix domain-containing protein [Nocardioides nematodiphilus]